MGTLPTNPGKPPGPPSPDMGPPVLIRTQPVPVPVPGYSKGTAKVPPHGSFRGDKNGSLTANEYSGVPHPGLSQGRKK